MPLLDARSARRPLPSRVLVAGASGSGKTTVADALARASGLPRTEIDGLFHGPGWVPRPTFVADVAALVAGPAWVVEWQYRQVRPLLLDRAELLVWVDTPRWRQMWQVSERTVRRRLWRQELWNGNRERPLWRILVDTDHIVRWAWKDHTRTHERLRVVLAERPDLDVVRLRTRRDQRRWLAGLGRLSGGCGTPAPPR